MIARLRASATKFWHELQRRRVIKTSIAYTIGAWIAVEVSSTVFPLIYFPDWTVRLVVLLAFMGMPIVVILAWVYDIERKPGNSGDSPDYETRHEKTVYVDHEIPPLLSSAEVSVAILPFDNVSSDRKYEFFALGFSAELHSALSRVHRVRVAARRSALKYSDSATDIRLVGQDLNVQFVVSGSVSCSDDKLRVLVQIDDASNGVQVWSGTYDRSISDTLNVQQDIADAVAGAFGGVRLREEIVRAGAMPTGNLNAWSRVQKARSYLLNFTSDSLDSAVKFLQEAIDIDPDYAVAHAALASVLGERLMNGFSSDFDSDKHSALAAARRAHDLSPDDPLVLKMSGVIYAYVGETEQSLQLLRRAINFAPFDFGAWGYMGWALVETGNKTDLSELQDIMNRLIESAPDHPGSSFWLFHRSVAATCCGELENAVKFSKASMARNSRFPFGWYQCANALGASGQLEQASDALRRCRELSPQLDVSYYEKIIDDMYKNKDTAQCRLAGIRAIPNN
jgi:TolB-like protein